MKEVEIRGRLVAARNGLEYAVQTKNGTGQTVYTRSALFTTYVDKPSEMNDKWLMKAVRSKSWQRDYLDRCVTVGIFEKLRDTNRGVLFSLINARLASEVVIDFDAHGMLLSKLVVPNMVEVGTRFDTALADKPEESELITPEGDVLDGDEEVDPDTYIRLTAGELGTVLLQCKQTLKGTVVIAELTRDMHTKMEKLMADQDNGFANLTAVFRSRFNKVESAIGELSKLSDKVISRVTGLAKQLPEAGSVVDLVKAVIDEFKGLDSTLRHDKEVVVTSIKEEALQTRASIEVLQTSLGNRTALQHALAQLKASQSDTAAAIDILMTAAEEEGGDDAEQSG